FWARRARRLLPASLALVIVTLVAARFTLDPLKQVDVGHDAMWASAFIINIKFAMGDSYAAAQTTPTPLLHFWSLAVEEQFYMIWPFLVYALTRVKWRTRSYALAIMGLFFVQSLLAWIWFAPWAHTPVFFLLPTRAWELIAGAMLALAGSKIARIPWRTRAIGAWVGLLLIAYCVATYHDTANLGASALVPVLATVAVIAASTVRQQVGPAKLLGAKPMVWIGNRSYGIYLWHWPALVLLDAKFGPLSAPTRVVILLGAIGAAALSYHFLENPIRHSDYLQRLPARSLALGGSLVVVGLVAGLLTVHFPKQDVSNGGVVAAPTLPGQVVGATDPASSASTGGTGLGTDTTVAAADTTTPAPTSTLAPTIPVTPMAELLSAQRTALDEAANITQVPANATPPVAVSKGDKAGVYRDGCVLKDGDATLKPCVYGDPNGTTTVALFGDSHAAQWFPALELLASDRHWHLEVFVKSGCPTADVRIKRTFLDPECQQWRANVATRLGELHPSLLVMASTSYDPGGSDVGVPSDTAWRRGLTDTLTKVRPSAGQLLIIGDTPLPAHEVPNCLSAFPSNVHYCGAEKAKAVNTSRIALEDELATQFDGHFVSTTDWLCGTTFCPVIEGNIVMWRDNNHVSATMAKFLTPFLASTIVPLVP
ncbi:MAG: hypothetical protein RJA49_1519, partial [Actinomycetota bacterium]